MQNIPATAIVITSVPNQPISLNRRLITNAPMMSERDAINIITTIIGIEITPFITALQNNAFIGSIGVKQSATPIKVAMAMIP